MTRALDHSVGGDPANPSHGALGGGFERCPELLASASADLIDDAIPDDLGEGLARIFALSRSFGLVAVVADAIDLGVAVCGLRVLTDEPPQHPLAMGDDLGHRPPGTSGGTTEVTR